MNKIKQLLTKFWEGNLSGQESGELDSLLGNEENEFKKDLERQFHEAIALKNNAGTKDRSKAKIFSIRRRSVWWAAASVLAAIAGFYLLNHAERKKAGSRGSEVAVHKTADTASPLLVSNNTTAGMTIRLSDGSTALLAPKSSISYGKYFDGRTRNISLIGKAEFKVARDITRPFTVFAGEFATTALGTRFEVNALGKDDMVVKLFEGKVVVNSTSGGKKFDAVYLSPGQYVTLNVIDKTAKIKSFIKADNLHSPDRERNPDEGNDHMLTFERESLKNVFDKVSALYNMPIQYREKQIRELYFTGYIQRSDSIKNVLKVIANMNGLKLQDMGDHVVILGK